MTQPNINKHNSPSLPKYLNLHNHWPQRTLFGSSLESPKLMQNINYQNLVNGNWQKDREKNQAKKMQLDNLATQQALIELKKQLDLRKTKNESIQKRSKSQTPSLKSTTLPNFTKTIRPKTIENDTNKIMTLLRQKTPLKTFVDDKLKVEKYEIDGKNYDVYELLPDNSANTQETKISINTIPLNIRAKFGTKIANELLKDEKKVEETLSSMRQEIKVVEKPIETRAKSSHSNHIKQNAQYYDLSNYLRHNICHGYPQNYRESLMKYDYNADV